MLSLLYTTMELSYERMNYYLSIMTRLWKKPHEIDRDLAYSNFLSIAIIYGLNTIDRPSKPTSTVVLR